MSKKKFNFLKSTSKSFDLLKKFVIKDQENFVTNLSKYFYSSPLSLVDKNLFQVPIQKTNPITEFGKSYVKESNNYAQFKTGHIFGLNKFFSKNNLNHELTHVSKRSFATDSNATSIEIKKMIATGGDFRDVVTKSSIFVDKSLFIKEVMEESAQTILIAMPRRWGKTLNLDMLKRFLAIEVDPKGQLIPNNETDNYKLFAGGEINITSGFKNITKELTELKLIKQIPEALSIQGQFPVIKMDFKDCKGRNFEDVQMKLKDKIFETVRNFSYLQSSEKPYKETTFGQEYITLLNKAKNNIFPEAIKELSTLLYAYHGNGKKVWILIDEYDAAANQAYLEFSTEEAKQVSELFRSIFEPALKSNDCLEKGILTGVQYIVKSGMLSGLNNISKYNVTSSKYSRYYGINEEEMNLLLAHFNIEELHAKRIKDWYNGYKENIGRAEDQQLIDKYNIWSVVNYLNRQNEGFKSYWEDSRLGQVINKEILKNPTIKKQVERLINNDNLILDKLISDFSIDNFKELKEMTDHPGKKEISQNGVELLFSYLFITGYLTITSKHNEYTLPNKEIKTEFETKIKEYYKTIFNIEPDKFSNLTKIIDKIFYCNSSKEIKSILKNDFAPCFEELIKSVKLYKGYGEDGNKVGLFANEDLMHSLLNNIVLQVVNSNFASERYTTKTDGKKGRADIIIEKNNTGVVIEMKYDGNAKEALDQSKEYIKLIEKCETKVFVGCNISAEQDITLSGDIVTSESTVHFDYT